MSMIHAIILILAVSTLPEAKGSSVIRSDSHSHGNAYAIISPHGTVEAGDYVANGAVAQQLMRRSGREASGEAEQDTQLFQAEIDDSASSLNWCNPVWATKRFECGLNAVKGTIKAAQADTAQASGLVTHFEDALFRCVQATLEGTALEGHADLTILEKKWDETFEGFDTGGINNMLNTYHQTGNVEELFGISEVLILEAIGTVKNFPDTTSTGEKLASTKDTVARYLTAVEAGTENIETLVLGVIQLQPFDFSGDWVRIIKPMIFQCAGAIDPLALQIVQGFDMLIGQIVGVVNDYMQRMAAANFCWKTPASVGRKWIHPNICPPDKTFSFGQGCLSSASKGLLLQVVDNAVSSKATEKDVDQTTKGKKPEPWKCAPPNCITPGCPADREQGMWGHKVVCFNKTCPAFYEVDSSKTDCVLPCPSRLPEGVGLICAKNAAAGKSAIINMVAGTFISLVEALGKVKTLVTSTSVSDVESKFSGTLNALAKIGHAFAAKNCKDVHAE